MTIVDNAIYVDGHRTAEPVTLEETYEAVRNRRGVAWIGLYKPTEEEFSSVAGEFGLHGLAVEDATDAVARTGACNTFWRHAERVRGDNTDVDGVLAAMEGLGVAGGKWLIAGTGGGARAAYQVGVLRAIVEMLPEGASNPFPWMSEMIDLKKEKNFFETRVTEYQTGGVLNWD